MEQWKELGQESVDGVGLLSDSLACADRRLVLLWERPPGVEKLPALMRESCPSPVCKQVAEWALSSSAAFDKCGGS